MLVDISLHLGVWRFVAQLRRGMEIVVHPPAKLNLGLSIQGKRADGYHLLQSVMVALEEPRDTLRLRLTPDLAVPRLTLSGIVIPDADAGNNLVLRAWAALRKRVPHLPAVEFELTKRIPAGAGLGGGSADAAYTLRALNTLCKLGLSTEELAQVARPLGADVPFFLYDGPQLVTGIGHDLQPVTIPHWPQLRVELRLTGIHSDTAQAYRDLQPEHHSRRTDLAEILQLPPEQWRGALVNDLETPVFARYPQLRSVRDELYAQGALYAAMSGSGSAVFGLFGR